MKKRRFTLIELLVVIGLAILLFSLMLPAFNAMTAGNKVDQRASLLKAALEHAQSKAVASRRPVALILPSGNSWTPAEQRMGGCRAAFVTVSGSTYTFDAWADEEWSEAPNGAYLLVAGTSVPSALAATYALSAALTAPLLRVGSVPGDGGSAVNAAIFDQYGACSNGEVCLAVGEAQSDGTNYLVPNTANFKTLKINQFTGRVSYEN